MTLLHNISRTLQRRRNSTWHALGYDTTVRPETPADFAAIAHLTHTAFNSNTEVQLISTLRQQADECIALVAEQHGAIVGHILFSPATLDNAPGTRLMALAPMAVSNVLQHQGIGSALVRAGLEQCHKQGVAAVVVLGHPGYYPRFGFTPASRFNISCPWQAADNAFMALELEPGALKGKSGKVVYHPAFAAL
ncbi:N-acetyltransferase [Rheinheimera sp. YQF-2]|uniref:N-acetyltransferase n=1 Tax=Rheinheimera lutimaris TaxID=2740584 RepID=A0A7Y5EJC9_9GAMM|nr:N-acetyltransferase [Rheinheimera lutimaris]NRQ44505.1 N-acetyltransferase [Rheinheimera lutimaris]